MEQIDRFNEPDNFVPDPQPPAATSEASIATGEGSSAAPDATGQKPTLAAEKKSAPRLRAGRSRNSAHPILYPGLTWVLGLMIGVLALRYLVPHLAEEIQYSITRGQQRAKYELAGEHLSNAGLNDLSLAYQMVSQRVSPSVVHISTVRVEDARPVEEKFRKMFGRLPPRESRGQGSGVIVDPEGYILTNYHVIHGARDIHVQLSDGRLVVAERVGDDIPTDLAVLKIAVDGLVAAEWGDSNELDVGALVWAVGSPFGLDHTVTSGILSARDRRTIAHSAYQDFLQTDAAVNPGNSGGPLVNVQGQVVGINTAIIGDSFQGVSFALASNIARRQYERIREHGYVPRGWLGVGLQEVTPELAAELDMDLPAGVYVPHVINDEDQPSPAARAGMRQGDVIIRFNGHDIDSPLTLSRKVAEAPIGSPVDVVVLRDGAEHTLEVIVGERPIELN